MVGIDWIATDGVPGWRGRTQTFEIGIHGGEPVVLNADNHNSVNGIRESGPFARRRAQFLPLRPRPRSFGTWLDASALGRRDRLDLPQRHPDYGAISRHKVFRYPTGIRSLIVRRETMTRLGRPWFAGHNNGTSSVS